MYIHVRHCRKSSCHTDSHTTRQCESGVNCGFKFFKNISGLEIPSQFQRVKEILILKHTNATYTSYFSLQDSHSNLSERRPTGAWTKDFANHLARPSGRFCKTWSNSAVEGGAWRDEGISRHKMSGSTHHNLGGVSVFEFTHLRWYNPVYAEPINCCRSIILSWWNFQPLWCGELRKKKNIKHFKVFEKANPGVMSTFEP